MVGTLSLSIFHILVKREREKIVHFLFKVSRKIVSRDVLTKHKFLNLNSFLVLLLRGEFKKVILFSETLKFAVSPQIHHSTWLKKDLKLFS